MPERPQEGYRAAGRIERGSSRRSRLLLGVVAVIAAGWLAANLTSRPSTALETGRPPTRDPIETRVPPTPRFTQPPFVTLLDGAPTDPIPIVLNGLAMLDPETATISRPTSNVDAQWPFLLGDGSTVCVCLIESGLDTLPGLRIARTAAGDGERPASETVVDGWALPEGVGPAFLDVAVDAVSDDALVASAALRGGSWAVRLDRISLDGLLVDQVDVASVPAEVFDAAGGARGVRLWIAPDDGRVRLTLAGRLRRLAAPAPPAQLRSWLVETPVESLGPIVELEPELAEPAPGECMVDGWARPDAFVRVCLEPGSHQGPAIVLHRLSVDGDADTVTVGTATRFDNHGWLIDGSAGVVYGWSPMEQLLFRVDVDALEVETREVPVPDGSLAPIEADWPAARAGRAAWTPGEAGRGTTGEGFVGSPDGSVLYAAGREPDPAPLETVSNGIYAFDAATLAVIGHWIPMATYESLGLTADGQFLMALGLPSPVELAAQGNVGPSLVLHDARSGDAVAILRRIQTRLGGPPSFLVARPGS